MISVGGFWYKKKGLSLFFLINANTFRTDRLAFHSIEGFACDWLLTVPAHEASRMPLSVQGGHVVLHDGTVAAAALGRKQVEVVVAAVRLAVLLVKAVLAELFAALGAEEVLRVPGLLECRHAFIKDGAIAVRTSGGEQVVIVGFTVGAGISFEEVSGSQFLITVGANEMFRMPGFS